MTAGVHRPSKSVGAILTELEQRDLLPLAKDVAKAHRVTVDELLAPGRDYLACRARHALWRRLWDDPQVEWSQSRIAKLFGVDHSSVLRALYGRPRRAA